jgi:hypothetical protein
MLPRVRLLLLSSPRLNKGMAAARGLIGNYSRLMRPLCPSLQSAQGWGALIRRAVSESET